MSDPPHTRGHLRHQRLPPDLPSTASRYSIGLRGRRLLKGMTSSFICETILRKIEPLSIQHLGFAKHRLQDDTEAQRGEWREEIKIRLLTFLEAIGLNNHDNASSFSLCLYVSVSLWLDFLTTCAT